MNKKEKAALIEDAKILKGRRSTRFIDISEIEIMLKLDRKKSLKGKTIRVYSEDGFVSNSYKYRSQIDWIVRWYDKTGKKHFGIGSGSAARSNGTGALITVNGRGY